MRPLSRAMLPSTSPREALSCLLSLSYLKSAFVHCGVHLTTCLATDPLHRSLFVSLQSLVQALESCPVSGAPWFFAMPLSLGRCRVINRFLAFQSRLRARSTNLPYKSTANSRLWPVKFLMSRGQSNFHQVLLGLLFYETLSIIL